jgi:hypothetical protein
MATIKTTGMTTAIAIAGDGGDPRINDGLTTAEGPIPPSTRLLHDPAVTFEEYQYYAGITRAEEDETFRTNPPTTGLMQVLFPTKSDGGVKPIEVGRRSPGDSGNEKEENGDTAGLSPADRIAISEAEWTNASRALRTASGAACFYLITTDILGPFGIG